MTTQTSNYEMPRPQIVIPRMVYEKINHWVQRGNNHECSGLGVTKVINGKIHVIDAVMLKQKNAGASTDMDAQSINEAMFKFRNHDGDLNFWWHSHADMGVFWSGTDTNTIAQIGGQGMCVAVVFNKKREYRAAVACMEPIPFFVDQISMEIDNGINKEIIDEWDKEYDENIVKAPPATMESRWGINSGWSGNIASPREDLRRNVVSTTIDEDEYDGLDDILDYDWRTGMYLMNDGRKLDEKQIANYYAKKEIIKESVWNNEYEY